MLALHEFKKEKKGVTCKIEIKFLESEMEGKNRNC